MFYSFLTFLFVLATIILVFGFNLYIFYSLIVTSRCGKYPPYFPSFGKMKKVALLEACKILSQATSPQNIIDMGCGSGGMLIPLARQYPEHKFIGYEWNKFAFWAARFYTRKYTNITIVNGDFMQAPLSEQNLVLCFTCVEIAQELSNKLLEELPANSFVISSAFQLHGFTRRTEIAAKTYGFMPIKVFVYQQS